MLRDLSETHFPDAAKIVLVQDNLNIHKPASLLAFPAPEARRLVERFEWHYTPKHGSWLDMAESELGVLASQCLIQKGVLTTAWLVFLIIAMLVVWAVATITFYTLVVPWTWLALAIGLSVALSLLLARGLLVEWLLDRRYFRHSTELRSPWSRARLASLSERDVDHVFCMTDLATGLPVYGSSNEAYCRTDESQEI